MKIEIDQSGRIEYTRVDTVIAFSDGIQKSILMPAQEKREIQKIFREAGKPLVFTYKTFALLIFLLVRNDLKSISQIIIDTEYYGWDFQIKDYLLREIRNHRHFSKDDIHFQRIGKKSRAHSLAYKVYAKREKPNMIVEAKDVAKLLL